MESRDILIALSVKYGGRFDSILKAIQNRETLSEADVNQLKSQISDEETVITMIDADYPEKLKKGKKPPFVIYLKPKGCVQDPVRVLKEALDGNTVSIVGRGDRLPEWEDNLIWDIGHHLSKQPKHASVCVNSLGGGVSPTYGRCMSPEKTIIVCGCGLDNINDAYLNATNGLYISEYPDGIQPSVEIYKERARIVAGISDTVIGVDLVDKSPAVETLRIAASIGGKKVFIASSENSEEHGDERDHAFNIGLANQLQTTILTKDNYKEELK